MITMHKEMTEKMKQKQRRNPRRKSMTEYHIIQTIAFIATMKEMKFNTLKYLGYFERFSEIYAGFILKYYF